MLLPLITLIVISIFSLSTIYSTVPSLFLTQLIFILVGIIIIISVARLNLRQLTPAVWLVYAGTLASLLLTIIVGEHTRGSVRWIDLGIFKLQTSELAKPLLVFCYAHLFQTPPHSNGTIHQLLWLLKLGVVGAIPILLVFIQPDLGSSLVLAWIWFSILITSGITKKQLLVLGLSIVTLVAVVPLVLKPYQLDRLTSFTNPFRDPSRQGYNVIQSMIAVGSGMWLGKGIRQGTQSHLKFLPERHTDFAFASFAEEFGFVGISVLLLSFVLLLLWLIKLAESHSGFNRLLVYGVFQVILFQFIVNVGMNIGLMPVTGITLPLFSYGGSSLLSLSILLGMAFSTLPQLHRNRRLVNSSDSG